MTCHLEIAIRDLLKWAQTKQLKRSSSGSRVQVLGYCIYQNVLIIPNIILCGIKIIWTRLHWLLSDVTFLPSHIVRSTSTSQLNTHRRTCWFIVLPGMCELFFGKHRRAVTVHVVTTWRSHLYTLQWQQTQTKEPPCVHSIAVQPATINKIKKHHHAPSEVYFESALILPNDFLPVSLIIDQFLADALEWSAKISSLFFPMNVNFLKVAFVLNRSRTDRLHSSHSPVHVLVKSISARLVNV